MLPPDPTIYESHYVWRQSQGWPGWFNKEALEEVIRELRERLAGIDLVGKDVLEVGCGAGDQALVLAEVGARVVGADLSETAIQWARQKAIERNLPATFLVEDVREMKIFADASFDIVLDGNCWHFIIGDGRTDFLANVHRVLRPGGLFLVNTVCGMPELMPGTHIEGRVQVLDGVPITYFGDAEDLLEELRACGLHPTSWSIRPGRDGERSDFLTASAIKQ